MRTLHAARGTCSRLLGRSLVSLNVSSTGLQPTGTPASCPNPSTSQGDFMASMFMTFVRSVGRLGRWMVCGAFAVCTRPNRESCLYSAAPAYARRVLHRGNPCTILCVVTRCICRCLDPRQLPLVTGVSAPRFETRSSPTVIAIARPCRRR